jgi:hypothetical protein
VRVKRVESRAQVRVAITEVASEGDGDARNRLLLPARRQDLTDASGAGSSTPDHIFEA